MYENYQDVLATLQGFGLLLNSIEVDTAKAKRCAVDLDLCPVDKEKSKKAGWYWFNSMQVEGKTFIVGSYGYWKGQDNLKESIKLDKTIKLTPEQREAIRAQHKEALRRAEAERKFLAEKAAKLAKDTWSKSLKEGECSYLAFKQVQAHGVRFHPGEADAMVIPMLDAKSNMHGLQIIRGSNNPKTLKKEFYPTDMDMRGTFHLSSMPNEVLLIAEGYATFASVLEATGLPTACVWNVNNIAPAVKELKKAYPRTTIVICADDDYLQKCILCTKMTTVTTDRCIHCDGLHNKKNAGVELANLAAMSVGGLVVIPNFIDADGQDIRNGQKLNDFNDLACHAQGGPHLVRAQIQAVTQNLITQKPATENLPTQQGEGERNQARSVLEVDEIVARFRFCDDDTGDYVFDTWTHKMVKRNKMVQMLMKGVRFDDVKSHPVWESNAVYLDEIGFDPTLQDKKIKCNMYTGWPTKPATLDDPVAGCSKILDLLKFVCDSELNSDEVYNWVLNWMAYPIQNPGAKMQTALVFHGLQGTGKSLLWETYARIYGDYGIIINQGAMEDKFNSDWASRKLFAVADEVVARSDMYHMKNQLKSMITGEWIRINPKNVAATKERNHLNLVFLSNEHNPVVLEGDDRRHFVVWTPKKLEESFYYDLVEQIESGGLEAFHQLLLQIDLGDFKHYSKPPMTRAKQDLMAINADTPEAFIADWIGGELDLPFGPVQKTTLYLVYKKWCSLNGERFPRNARQFIPYLKKFGINEVTGSVYENLHMNGASKSVRLAEPTDALLEELKAKQKNGGNISHIQFKQEGIGLSIWRTESVIAFDNKFNGGIYAL